MTVPRNTIHSERAYVVRLSRTARIGRVLLIVGVILVLPLITYVGTVWHLGEQHRDLTESFDRQTAQMQSLNEELISLAQAATNAELASEVDRGSVEQMRIQMMQAREQIDFLSEQVRLYQSLMDPDPEKSGVYLERVDIEPAETDGAYLYNIIVAQRSSNHRKVSGTMSLQLISDADAGAARAVSLGELSQGGDFLALGFKFFQQFNGDLVLPEGFSPSKVRVIVRLDGSNSPSLDETYAWKS